MRLSQKCDIMGDVEEPKVLKGVRWIASAKDDLSAMPQDIKDDIGFALEQVQTGKTPTNSGAMKGKLRDVREIWADDEGGTYRAMYTTEIGDVVYVLDAFRRNRKVASRLRNETSTASRSG